MRIDISSILDAVSAVVDFMKGLSFSLGDYTFSLWAVVVALGTIESITFILGMRRKNKTD